MASPSASPRSWLREAAWWILLALIPAALTAWLHPRKPEWSFTAPAVPQVSLATVESWSNVLWLDARSSEAFATQHIPGAVSLNENEWNNLIPGFLAQWQPDRRVVVYCDTERCNASQEVALRLQRELAVTEVYVLKDGWGAWQEAHP